MLDQFSTAKPVAAATDASFIREVVCGTYESDMGLWSQGRS